MLPRYHPTVLVVYLVFCWVCVRNFVPTAWFHVCTRAGQAFWTHAIPETSLSCRTKHCSDQHFRKNKNHSGKKNQNSFARNTTKRYQGHFYKFLLWRVDACVQRSPWQDFCRNCCARSFRKDRFVEIFVVSRCQRALYKISKEPSTHDLCKKVISKFDLRSNPLSESSYQNTIFLYKVFAQDLCKMFVGKVRVQVTSSNPCFGKLYINRIS